MHILKGAFGELQEKSPVDSSGIVCHNGEYGVTLTFSIPEGAIQQYANGMYT